MIDDPAHSVERLPTAVIGMAKPTINGRVKQTPFALILVSALFLLPIGLLVALLLHESRKDIVFVEKEIAGVRYVGTIWPVIEDVLTSRGPHTEDALRRWEGIRQSGEAYDVAMGTFEARRTLGQAMGQWDAKGSVLEILQAAASLINKIDDGSNLTLDPDLESFYLIDSATVKLPELAVQSASFFAIDRSAPKGGPTGGTDLEARMNAARLTERFRASLAAFDNSVDGVSRASAVLHPSVASARKAIDSVASDLIRATGADATGLPMVDEAASPATSDLELVRAESRYWAAATSELDRILASRLNQLVRAQWISLTSIAALCLAIFVVVGSMAFSANRSIDKIVKVFRRP